MALKLKLKMGGSPPNESSSQSQTPKQSKPKTPKLKIKPPKVHKPKTEPKTELPPEKVKKLKINFGPKKNQQVQNQGIEGITQPVKKVPKVRVKPTRMPGDGYDSETPDFEDDPLMESGIVVRFLDDMNLDFVHNAVESNDLSGINIKWLTKDKALVNLRGNVYSGRLVDLPTVSELYKTLDKKNIFKIIDLCQMLLVIKLVNPNDLNLDSDFEVPLESTYRHPLYEYATNHEIKETRPILKDGLIYPFENVFRRFKPRKINHRVMDDIDSRVNELIRLDNEAEESHFEIIDPNAPTTGASRFSPSPPPSGQMAPPQMGSSSQMEAAGSSLQGYQTATIQEDMNMDMDENSDLEEELAKALETNVGVIEEDEDGNQVIVEGATPMADDDEEDEEDEEEDEDDDDDDDDDDDEDEDDDDDDDDNDNGPDSKSENQHIRMLEEEIADLEKAVEVHRKGLVTATHKMMKMKFQNSFNTLKASLDGKKRELAKVREENEPGEQDNENDEEGNEENDDEDNEDNDEENEENEENEDNEDNEEDQDRPDEPPEDSDEEKLDDLDDLF